MILLILIIVLFFFVSISLIYFTIRLHVPPMMSSPEAMIAIAKLIPTDSKTIIDVGSGWGNLIFILARKYPDRKIIAYELSPFPYLISMGIKYLFRFSNVKIYRKDGVKTDIPDNACIVTYLCLDTMNEIKNKIDLGKWKPSYLISNTYALPGYSTHKQYQLKNIYRSRIFIYKF